MSGELKKRGPDKAAAEYARQIQALSQELTAAHTALWCLAHQNGGEVSISKRSLDAARRGRLAILPSADGLAQVIRAEFTEMAQVTEPPA